MNTRKLITLVVWVLAAMLLVSGAVAQETTAGLQGTVKDQQGAVVNGATVELTSDGRSAWAGCSVKRTSRSSRI